MTNDTKQNDSATIIEELARLDLMEALEPFPVYSSDFAPAWISQYRRERSHEN